jgi:hypothetical protein
VPTLPICPETGEDVDDCDCAFSLRCPNCDERGSACQCVDVRDYDADDAADDVYQQALDERGGQD